jgi:predicted N-acetyltransferase YhbS
MEEATMETITLQRNTIRPLLREDLPAVVAIDAVSQGSTRHAYFARRLEAALREPKLHAQFAAIDDKGVAGYILARVLEGEFGRPAPAFRLEVIGVRSDAKGHHVGACLFDALSDHGRRHGIAEVRTTVAWNDHRMMRWMDAMGFTLAANHVVDCAVAGGRTEGRGRGARDQLRRSTGQRLRPPRAGQRGRSRDGTGRPRRHRPH